MSGRSSGGESLMKSVNEKCESVPFLKRLSAQLGVKPALVVFAGLSFLVPFVVFGIGGSTICNMAGSIIPAVYSFRALEDNNVDRLKVLMKYWIIHALLLIVEVFVDVILFWVPMYYLLKLMFTLYLLHPSTKGAEKVFDMVLPLCRSYAPIIEDMLQSFISLTSQTLENWQSHGGEKRVE